MKCRKGMGNDETTVVVIIEQEPECVICLEPKNLVANTRCSCVYHYHKPCMYMAGEAACILCKKKFNLSHSIQSVAEEEQQTVQPNICFCICCGVIVFISIMVWVGIGIGLVK